MNPSYVKISPIPELAQEDLLSFIEAIKCMNYRDYYCLKVTNTYREYFETRDLTIKYGDKVNNLGFPLIGFHPKTYEPDKLFFISLNDIESISLTVKL